MIAFIITQPCKLQDISVENISNAFEKIVGKLVDCRIERVAIFSDKPVYKNGETVHITAYFYHLITKIPITTCQDNNNVSLSIYDSKDSFIASIPIDKTSNLDLSAVDFTYVIGSDLPGGIYSVRFDNLGIKDEISIFILNFNNRAFAIVGDWNADIIRTDFILKGLLTVKALTTDVANIKNGVIKYSFIDGNGIAVLSQQQPLTGNNFQVNYQIPKLDSRLLTFTAQITSDTYSTLYSKDFYTALYDEAVIDFALATGKIVLDYPNKFYFQTFSNEDRVDTYTFNNANILINVKGVSKVLKKISSDEDGRGLFSIEITNQNIIDQAQLILRVMFSETETRDFPIIDLSNVSLSAVSLNLETLVYKPTDNLQFSLASKSFANNILVVLQSKTRVFYSKKVSLGNKKGSGPFTQNFNILLKNLGQFYGGVYTLQIYRQKPKSETCDIPTPASTNPPITKLPANANQDKLIVRPKPIFPPPIDNDGVSINYQGEILQEVDIFIKPSSIIGASISLNKSFYVPGETINATIRLDNNCPNCDPNIAKSNVRGYVIVTDESAFLEIEKSRENPSLFTKIFLQKEIWNPKNQFKNSFRYIDYIFNGKSNYSEKDIKIADSKLHLLLGNQSKRKFLYTPDVLQKFLNSPYDALFSNSEDYYNYLVPRMTPLIPFFRSVLKNFKGPLEADIMQRDKPQPSPPQPGQQTTPDQLPKHIENALKKDTILYQRLKIFSNNVMNFSFKLPDYATNFSVRVYLMNENGRYGYVENSVKVRKPINIILDQPIYIYTDEAFTIPVIVENNQSIDATINFISPIKSSLIVKTNGSSTQNITFKANELPLTITITDASNKTLLTQNIMPDVVTAGIRQLRGTSGFVSTQRNSNSNLALNEILPSKLIRGNNTLKVCYKNSIISIILDVIRTFNQIPTGCFEQASRTTFPLIISIQILKLLPQTPEVVKLLAELIDNLKKGIDLLLTYECSQGGFEWFGSNPGHSTLTAYGVWQFDLIKKLKIDELSFDSGVLQRSQNFINSQRNNKGGFTIRSGLDELGNPEQTVSDIFIVYILSVSNSNFQDKFQAEYSYIKTLYSASKNDPNVLDSYKLALIGLLFVNMNENALAFEIVGILSSRQNSLTGEIQQGLTTICRSVGASLAIETTSLAMLLILRLKDTTHNVVLQRALKFILSNLKGGYFASTQATVLSLLAISEYLAAHTQTSTSILSFDVQLNTLKAKSFSINSASSFESKCLDISDLLSKIEDSNLPVKVVVKPKSASLTDADNQYFFEIDLETYSYLPNSTLNSPLSASMTVSQSTTISTYTLKLINAESKQQGMVVWEFNKPSCYDFNINNLEALREQRFIDYYEIRDSNSKIVFYWRGLKPLDKVAFKVTLNKRFALNNCIERTNEVYLYYGRDISTIYPRI